MDRSLRILLVEDDESSRDVLTRILTRFGHHVSQTGSVAEALNSAQADRFDLLLSDLCLPDGTGFDLMCQLRQFMPGIAISGLDDTEASSAAGFARHIHKPILLDKLLLAVRQVIEMSDRLAGRTNQLTSIDRAI